MLHGLLGVILGCGGSPDESPAEVQFMGCAEVSTGPTCWTRSGAPITLWRAGAPAPLTLDGTVLAVSWTEVEGGHRATIPDDAVGRLALPGFTLTLVQDDRAPDAWQTMARAGDRQGALEALRADLETASGVPRLRLLHGLSRLQDPEWPAERVEAEAVAQEEWWWAAREALLVANRVYKQQTIVAHAAIDRAEAHQDRAGGLGGRIAQQIAYYRGLARFAAGDQRRAIEAQRAAIQVARRGGSARLERQARAKLADALLMAGRTAEGLALMEPTSDAVGHCEQASQAINLAWALLMVAERGTTEASHHQRADALLGRALAQLGDGPCESARHDREAYAAVAHLNRALAALQGGEPERAQAELVHAVATDPDLDDPWLHELRGRTELARGNLDAALAIWTAMIDAGTPSLDHAWMALRGQGLAHARAGALDAALVSLEKAQQLFVEQSVLIPVHLGRAAYLGQREDLAAQLAVLHLERGDPQRALDAIRSFRAQYLYGIYQTSRIAAQGAGSDEAWNQALDSFRAGQAAIDALPSPEDVPASEVPAVEAARAAAIEQLKQAVDQANLAVGVALSPARRRADPGEWLLAWAETPEGWIGFAEHDERTEVHRYAQRPDGADWLAPWASAIRAAREVTALPPALGHDLAVHALPLEGTPLLFAVPVRYRLDLGGAPRVAASDGRIVVVGDPEGNLSGARREVEQVAERLRASGRQVVSLVGGAARRASVLAQVDGADWLHFSGHGAADSAWDSRLLLADGAVRVSDVLMLEAPPRVALLNACETAAQEAGTALGVAQAFAAAGSTHVVATAASVPDDDAAAFSDDLYAARADGASVGEAYRAAALAAYERDRDGSWALFRWLTP